jgi:hypothetical protein
MVEHFVWQDSSWKQVGSPLELIPQKQFPLGQATQLYVVQVPPEVQTGPTEVEVVVLDAEDDREIEDSARGVKLDVTDFEVAVIAVVKVEFLIWDVGWGKAVVVFFANDREIVVKDNIGVAFLIKAVVVFFANDREIDVCIFGVGDI